MLAEQEALHQAGSRIARVAPQAVEGDSRLRKPSCRQNQSCTLLYVGDRFDRVSDHRI